jgi:hypothetical protein
LAAYRAAATRTSSAGSRIRRNTPMIVEGAQLPLPLSDYAMAFYQIEAVHANSITVRARVPMVSATAGATFKLRVTVRV